MKLIKSIIALTLLIPALSIAGTAVTVSVNDKGNYFWAWVTNARSIDEAQQITSKDCEAWVANHPGYGKCSLVFSDDLQGNLAISTTNQGDPKSNLGVGFHIDPKQARKGAREWCSREGKYACEPAKILGYANGSASPDLLEFAARKAERESESSQMGHWASGPSLYISRVPGAAHHN